LPLASASGWLKYKKKALAELHKIAFIPYSFSSNNKMIDFFFNLAKAESSFYFYPLAEASGNL
jgi:hypothetical protein